MTINIFFRPLQYLDPGSGSILIQLLLGGLLGIAVAVRIYWKKIKSFFKKGEGESLQEELDEMDEYGGEDS